MVPAIVQQTHTHKVDNQYKITIHTTTHAVIFRYIYYTQNHSFFFFFKSKSGNNFQKVITLFRRVNSSLPSIIHCRRGWNPKAGWKWENNDSILKRLTKMEREEEKCVRAGDVRMCSCLGKIMALLIFESLFRWSITMKAVKHKTCMPFIIFKDSF